MRACVHAVRQHSLSIQVLGELREGRHMHAESTPVREMEVQHVHLAVCHGVHHLLQHWHGGKSTTRVDQQATVNVLRLVVNDGIGGIQHAVHKHLRERLHGVPEKNTTIEMKRKEKKRNKNNNKKYEAKLSVGK